MSKPRILIVEDDRDLREALVTTLELAKFRVVEAADGHEALLLLAQTPVDMVVSDVNMPKLSGHQLLAEVQRLYPGLPMLLMTAYGQISHAVSAMQAGATDYLVKPFDMRELLARVQALIKRSRKNPLLNSTILKIADLEMNLQTKIVKRNNTEINLTPKEFKLLEYMLQNPERVLSRTEIAENVWDTHFDTGTNFIDVYINYLRKKIDRNFDPKLIHTKPGMGFILQIQ